MKTHLQPVPEQLPPPPALHHEPDQDVPLLGDYLDTIVEARWLVTAAVLGALLCGGLYVVAATPTYQADVLVQIEAEKGKGLLSQLEDLPGMVPQTPAETEIEILRTRTLLGSVVDELHLDTTARPRWFPVFGAAVARWRAGDEPAAPLLGLPSFAWGGERIQVPRLSVPSSLEDTPLTLVALGEGRYELRGPAGVLLAGEVGKAAESTPDARTREKVELFVAELVSRPGTQFELEKLQRKEVVEKLQEKLSIVEKGRKTGVLRISLAHPDQGRVAAIVDAIAQRYLRQNVERKSAEAEKTLEFITTQLPLLKSNVDVAENSLSRYRSNKNAAVDLSLETKAILDRSSEIEKRAAELQLQRAELRQRFTENHPAVISLRQKEASIEAERTAINSQLKVLPESELNSVRLMRDVKVANELYVLLLNKSQELKIVKSGTIGNVRMLDPAVVPTKPATPRPAGALSISLVVGLGLGIAAAFARRSLTTAIDDPEQIEKTVGLSVYATIPHSTLQASNSPKGGRLKDIPLLAEADPNDLSIESLRSLRVSVQFAMLEARNNVIAISGPSPGIGKSFVVANLAHVMAEVGKRVVVVDADLRKGRLHHYFGVKKGPGLSEAIRGAATLEQAVRPTSTPTLHVLPMGEIPPNPSELLSSRRFEELVSALSSRFDLVLFDTAPILAVADAALVGKAAGLELLVLRAGQHTMREIALSVKRLRQNGITTHAVIMNDVRPRGAGYGYGRYHYHYKYQ